MSKVRLKAKAREASLIVASWSGMNFWFLRQAEVNTILASIWDIVN
jgi:hypothetical protein